MGFYESIDKALEANSESGDNATIVEYDASIMPPTLLNTIEVRWFDSRYDTDEDVKDFFNDTDFKVIEKREYEQTLIAYLYTQRSDSEQEKQ